ncbi:hypothetical protein KC887_07965 [Candidatus Kaiserbacteria bacterium]|nr:hypothetical protein [Candidatus Kaiserbacteria bacterium]
MVDFSQNDYSVKSDWPWWNEHGNGAHTIVATMYGLVGVDIYMFHEYTQMEFAHNGRFYTRTWQRAWGKKTAVLLAREFAREIAGGD